MTRSEYLRAYVAANRERVYAVNKKWREHNKLRHRKNAAAWKRANPARHRQHVKKASKRYYARHRRKILSESVLRNVARRAQIAGVTIDRPGVRSLVIGLRCAPLVLCYYCSLPISGRNLCLDHVVPLSRGGDHTPANLTPCCLRCNSSKSNRLLSEWRARPFVHLGFDGCPVGWSPEKELRYQIYWGMAPWQKI